MENYLYECVQASLRAFLYANATFLCERLNAEFPSESNVHLLATCYFRSNKAHLAYHVLKGTTTRQCRYLFALVCMQMQSLEEAEATLLNSLEPGAESLPGSATSYYLLCVICKQSGRRQAAIGHYTQALSLDPFLWSAYEDLCGLGADEESVPVFSDTVKSQLQKIESVRQSNAVKHESFEHDFSLRAPASSNGSPKHRKLHSGGVISDAGSTVMISTSEGVSTYASVQNLGLGPPGPGRSNNPGANATGGGSGDGIGRGGGGTAGYAQQRRKFVDPDVKFRKSLRSLSVRPGQSQASRRVVEQVGPRMSTRLNMIGDCNTAQLQQPCPTSSVGATMVGTVASGAGAVTSLRGGVAGVTPSRMTTSRKQALGISVDDGRKLFDSFEICGGGGDGLSRSKLEGSDEERSLSARCASRGALELFQLLRILGEGYRHLCMLRCQEAVQSFSKLPQQHFATAWVLCQVGRAYVEMVNYPEAERVYSWARRVSPHCPVGMDMYSTALYHMKKDVQLSCCVAATERAIACSLFSCFDLRRPLEPPLGRRTGEFLIAFFYLSAQPRFFRSGLLGLVVALSGGDEKAFSDSQCWLSLRRLPGSPSSKF